MSYWGGCKRRSESGRSPANDRETLLGFRVVAFDERVTSAALVFAGPLAILKCNVNASRRICEKAIDLDDTYHGGLPRNHT
jgi:hypothetical protein